MGTSSTGKQPHIGAMELFGIAGFAFFFAYFLLAFFWLFVSFPTASNGFERGLVHTFVFIGLAVALMLVSFFKQYLFKRKAQVALVPIALVLACILPLEVFMDERGIVLPWIAVAVAGFCSGVSGACFLLCWLDGVGSARIKRYLTFTSAGMSLGTVLFFLVQLVVPAMQWLFALAYIGASFGFVVFLRSRTNAQVNVAPRPKRELLPFVKEIEPAIFTYGVVFGIGFSLMFIHSATTVLWGMLALFLGAFAVLVSDVLGVKVSITLILRISLVSTIASCLIIPFTEGWLYILGVCLIVATWAVFSSVNWAILVRRCVGNASLVFYSVASGIAVSAVGFLVGWVLLLGFVYFGTLETFLAPTMLILAFILVLVVMLFFPQEQHHGDAEAALTQGQQGQQGQKASNPTTGEGEKGAAFSERIDAVSKLYGLSAREKGVLAYLAKGRNASYIQRELVISPHTAKSHIYNIYRKLDIHSQQKLMDFIEEFPLT